MYAQAGQGNYIDFLVPGIVVMSVVFSAMFNGISVITDKQFGFLKETLVAPISRFSIIFGRTLGGATVATVQGILVFLVTFSIGFNLVSLAGLFPAFLFMFLIALFFTALGTSLATFFTDTQAFPLIINLIVMPVFFLSGALFPLEGLPKGFAWLLKLNPLTYGVDGLRGSLIGEFHQAVSFDFLVLGISVLLVLVLGSWLFSKVEG